MHLNDVTLLGNFFYYRRLTNQVKSTVEVNPYVTTCELDNLTMDIGAHGG